MIFLNAEKFIEEAIESVFAQTYQDWELLLVDDGSTDQSRVIARQYAQRYPQKVYYLEHPHHQNRGMSASRNLGISHAQGDYIAFLDADDVWLSQKLEQQIAILEDYPEAGMLYGRTEIWYSWADDSQSSRQDYCIELGVLPNTLIYPPKLLINGLTNYYQHPGTSNAIFRTELIEQFGVFEESFRGWGEDKVFFAKLQMNVPIFVSDKIWARYRQHMDSCCYVTSKNRKLELAAFQNFYDWMEQYIQMHHIESPEIWQALEAARYQLRQRQSFLYILWFRSLNFVVKVGRLILPPGLRNWLWVHIGLKLYTLIG